MFLIFTNTSTKHSLWLAGNGAGSLCSFLIYYVKGMQVTA